MTYFSGRVHSVVYENADNAFYIVRMFLDDKDGPPVGVKGTVPGIKVSPGVWFGFEANWVNSDSYGRQLEITRAPVMKGGWDADTACKTLVANGVGPQVMASIQSHFGPHLLDALESSELLLEVPGITEFVADHVASRWLSAQANFKALEYLGNLGLPPGLVRSIWRHFGDDSERILVKNPWALVEVDGITFGHAEEVARRSGLTDPEAQMRGAVLYACKAHRSFGHMYLRTGDILLTVNRYVSGATKETVLKALAGLHRDKLLIIDKSTRSGIVAVYEPHSYKMEKGSAEMLNLRWQKAFFVRGTERTEGYLKSLGAVGPETTKALECPDSPDRLQKVAEAAVAEWGSQAKLSLSGDQKVGIVHALTAPVSVLSGLPGTGKTTGLKAAVRILQDAGVPFLLCAPTGIAAKNLSARTGAVASTIHRAFSAKGQSDQNREATYAGVVGDSTILSGPDKGAWGYGPGNPHPADVIIVDEASMMDQSLLYRLLECTKPTARLIFVGDYAQLPSVGPGNVLRDLLNSHVFPLVRLTQIFRQGDTSGIVYAAHSMVNGEVPELNKDFKLLPLTSEEAVLEAILRIGERFFQERKNFQILSPKHKGTVGVTNLNTRLRELINPATPGLDEIRLGKDTIREGDRVMVVQNDYKLGVFNGDVGKVSKVNRSKKQIEVKIFGDMPMYVTIASKDAGRLLRMAYACTVHKSQGLEYDYIVMPLVTGFYQQLQRNLLYTAITRAKKKVILVGQHEALVSAVHNSKEDERATLFLDRLLGGLPASPKG